MTISAPFKLAFADIKAADLSQHDIGMWCIRADGCYHLFESEAQAKQAYDRMKRGEFVR